MQEALMLERQYLQAQLEREEAAAAAAKPSQDAQPTDDSEAPLAVQPDQEAAAPGQMPPQQLAAAAADDSLDAFMSSMDCQVEQQKVCTSDI